MFIVTYEDGTYAIEGKDGIANWDAIPSDKKISSVTITDGGQLHQTISGFQYYICCYNGIAVAATDGSRTGHRTVGQTVYGIKDTKPSIRNLQRIAGSIEKQVQDSYEILKTDNLIVLRARADQLEAVRKKLKELTKKIHETKIVAVTLGFNTEFIDPGEFTQKEKGKKEGVVKVDPGEEKKFKKEIKELIECQ